MPRMGNRASIESKLLRLLPKAIDEKKDPLYKSWKTLEEKWDERIPKDGFLSDFVYYNRGNEAPTAFAIWSALVCISAAVRKKVWIPWDRGRPLCPNMYVILVAPPGVCKKGTIMGAAGDIVERFPDMFPEMLSHKSENLEQFTDLMACKVIRDKATPEAMIRVLAGTNRTMVSNNVEGDLDTENTGSQALVLVPELSTFLGKERYAQNMSNLLTRLYDGDDKFEYIKVSAEGNEKALVISLRDPFLSFLAGTTEGSFRDSVSEEARGGGLLSRMIIVAIHETARVIPKPFLVKLLPHNHDEAIDEMARRLAWVSLNANTYGEFSLCPEADDFYVDWYKNVHKPRITQDEEAALVESRADVHLLKTAILIRAARYKPGSIIELQDMKDSMELLSATKGTMMSTLKMVDSTYETRNQEMVLRIIAHRGEITYRQLTTGYSRNLKSLDTKLALQALQDAGKIKTVNIKTGEPISYLRGQEQERYEFIGEKNG